MHSAVQLRIKSINIEPKTMTSFKAFSILAVSLWLTSCAVIYKQDIQQGNIITDEMLNNLDIGMDKAQVRYYLGTPLIEDPFHANRWDYYYGLLEGGNKEREQTVITLIFSQSELLTNIVGQSGVQLTESSRIELPDEGNLNSLNTDDIEKNRSFWQKIKSKVLGQ